MSFRLPILTVFCLLGLPAAQSAEAKLSETRSTLEKWVETRQLISRTAADWQAEKEMLAETARLFERELKSVQEQMSKLFTNNAQAEKERIDAETSKAASQAALAKARDFATGFEKELLALVPRLPVPLQDILKPLLNRIPSDPATTRVTAAERIQVIVGILNEFDKFNSAVNIFSEKRKNQAGEEVAVETVYVGLGAAYFVNEADDFAGMGAPGATGWDWTIKPELASPVREVVRIYKNERPARFVPLPAVIK